jgi:hypothetical protein
VLQWLGIALAVVGGAMLSYEQPAAATVQEEQLNCAQ